jgi:hypothetical protein
MPTIPTATPISLQAQLASGVWPAPPAWTTSDPDTSTISLVDGSGQFLATVTTTAATVAGTPLHISIEAGAMQGSIDLDVQDGAVAPGSALVVPVA